MKKTFTKILSFVLAAVMLLSIPVIAAAEDAGKFDFTVGQVSAASGKWRDDYVETLKVVIKRGATAYAADGVILTVGTNDTSDNVAVVTRADIISANFRTNDLTLEFKISCKLNHGDTYTIAIKEGAFKDRNGAVNNEFKFSATGNAIIETLDIEDLELQKSPMEQFVVWIDSLEYGWLLYPIKMIILWFLSL